MKPDEKARSSKTLVAVRILEAAAAGERDPDRLLAQALVPWRIEDMSVPNVSVARDATSPMESRSMRWSRVKRDHKSPTENPLLGRAFSLSEATLYEHYEATEAVQI